MGANRTQALAIVLFFLAFFALAGAMAAGCNVLLILLGLAILIGSAVLFRRAKPWEEKEEG